MSLANTRYQCWRHALRKQRICRKKYGWEYYHNLHQYSKNKIHCSCPLCSAKTNNRKNKYASRNNWDIKDLRRLSSMKEDMEGFLYEEEEKEVDI